MKKVKSGTEVANVLVGELDCLTAPVVLFMRLVQPIHLEQMSEISLPTRFVIAVLGPPEQSYSNQYMEMGRAVATILADEVGLAVLLQKRLVKVENE